IEFSSAEDPDGALQRAKGDDFIHGEENYIEYKKTILTDEEKPSIILAGPSSVGLGDVVELEISFRWFASQGGQAQFWVRLQSVTLVDDSTRRVSIVNPITPHDLSQLTRLKGQVD
ncbi:hypothetical protein AGABI2DRAFT_72224, partial [Agaricus bisporus var. bisporus H97]|uniref:hypothetical protein n=1 Tax=Agaricus bisporus var. bisporus (strain H97 / ATCC MYA-4626 / FGSC 10389) TaxID=936046 RepID=UPI00029F6A35